MEQVTSKSQQFQPENVPKMVCRNFRTIFDTFSFFFTRKLRTFPSHCASTRLYILYCGLFGCFKRRLALRLNLIMPICKTWLILRLQKYLEESNAPGRRPHKLLAVGGIGTYMKRGCCIAERWNRNETRRPRHNIVDRIGKWDRLCPTAWRRAWTVWTQPAATDRQVKWGQLTLMPAIDRIVGPTVGQRQCSRKRVRQLKKK